MQIARFSAFVASTLFLSLANLESNAIALGGSRPPAPPTYYFELRFKFDPNLCVVASDTHVEGKDYVGAISRGACGTESAQWKSVDRGNGYFSIESRAKGTCLDLADAPDGSGLYQRTCNPLSLHHLYRLELNRLLVSRLRDNECVDAHPTNTSVIHGWTCHGAENQQIEFRPASPSNEQTHPQVYDQEFYRLANPDLKSLHPSLWIQHWLEHGVAEGRQAHPTFHTLSYLRAYPDLQTAFGGASNRNQLAITHWVKYGLGEKRFGLLPLEIRPFHATSNALEILGASTQNGAAVIQQTRNGSRNQSWVRTYANGGIQYINVNSGKCVDVLGALAGNGVPVAQHTCHFLPNQTVFGNSNRILKFTHSNQCADIYGGQISPGAIVHQWDCHGGNNQSFLVSPPGGVDYIQSLYQNILGRTPSLGEIQDWSDYLIALGKLVYELRANFAYSGEAGDRIKEAYLNYLGRQASNAEISAWQAQMLKPDQGIAWVQRQIQGSIEAKNRRKFISEISVNSSVNAISSSAIADDKFKIALESQLGFLGQLRSRDGIDRSPADLLANSQLTGRIPPYALNQSAGWLTSMLLFQNIRIPEAYFTSFYPNLKRIKAANSVPGVSAMLNFAGQLTGNTDPCNALHQFTGEAGCDDQGRPVAHVADGRWNRILSNLRFYFRAMRLGGAKTIWIDTLAYGGPNGNANEIAGAEGLYNPYAAGGASAFYPGNINRAIDSPVTYMADDHWNFDYNHRVKCTKRSGDGRCAAVQDDRIVVHYDPQPRLWNSLPARYQQMGRDFMQVIQEELPDVDVVFYHDDIACTQYTAVGEAYRNPITCLPDPYFAGRDPQHRGKAALQLGEGGFSSLLPDFMRGMAYRSRELGSIGSIYLTAAYFPYEASIEQRTQTAHSVINQLIVPGDSDLQNRVVRVGVDLKYLETISPESVKAVVRNALQKSDFVTIWEEGSSFLPQTAVGLDVLLRNQTEAYPDNHLIPALQRASLKSVREEFPRP